MTNTIIATLATCGFDTTATTAHWAIGTLVWGHVADVKRIGADLYEVPWHHWFWDGADYEEDATEKVTLHGARALQYLFERLPLWRRW